MKSIKESFNGDELSDFLSLQIIEEGAVGDWFKKTFNYIKGKIAKLGEFFVSMFGDKVLPVVNPITSQLLVKKNKPAGIHWMGNAEDKKYSGVDTTGKDILNSRESTIDMWKRYASLNESKNIDEALKLAADDDQLQNIDNDEFAKIVKSVLSYGAESVPILIWGAPGVGKTAIIKTVLKEVKGANARLMDFQLSKESWDSFFMPSYNADHTRAVDIPKSTLPVYQEKPGMSKEERDAADAACGSGLLFFDELSRAKPDVQNICLKLVDERRVGDDYVLGSGWSIICASNRLEDDEESQNKIGAALGNRFIQYNYFPAFDKWREWANKHAYMNQDILDWLEQNSKYFYYQKDMDTTLYCTPRSWEKCCKWICQSTMTAFDEGFRIENVPDSVLERALAGAIGREGAKEFMLYVKLKRSVDLQGLKLVLTNPDKAPVPQHEGRNYPVDLSYIIGTYIISLFKTDPTPEEFANCCKWFVKAKDESFTHAWFEKICKKFPDMNYGFGEGNTGKFTDKYVKGLQILVDGYPDWEKADFSK